MGLLCERNPLGFPTRIVKNRVLFCAAEEVCVCVCVCVCVRERERERERENCRVDRKIEKIVLTMENN